jgi:hypothetical protein
MVGWVEHFLVLGDPDDAAFADILYREGRKDWQIGKTLDAVKFTGVCILKILLRLRSYWGIKILRLQEYICM